jgi:hypothetical protein
VPTCAIGVTIIRPNMTILLFWACAADIGNSVTARVAEFQSYARGPIAVLEMGRIAAGAAK